MNRAPGAPWRLLVLSGVLSLTAPALGADAAPLSLGIVRLGCGADLPETRELATRLSVELEPRQVRERDGVLTLEVVTSCTGVTLLTLRGVAEPKTRTVMLDDVAPELRPVALALLAAEFVGAPGKGAVAAFPGTEEGRPSPPAPVDGGGPTSVGAAEAPVSRETSPPLAPLPSREAARDSVVVPKSDPRRDPFRALIGAAGLIRWFPDPGTTLAGAELSARRVAWLATLGVAAGGQQDRLGSLQLGVASAGFGLHHGIVRGGGLRLEVAVKTELGWTWASARGALSNVQASSSGTPFALASAGAQGSVPLAGRFDLTLAMHGGFARGLVVSADQRDVAGTGGFVLSGTLGVDCWLP